MTAFQKSIVCSVLLLSFMWFFRLPKPDMTLVYPDDCVFIIDRLFSKTMQFEIKDFIDQAYKKSKNPSNLLPHIESKFPAIKSIVIDMHNPELLNFTIQTYQPLFLINDEHVICQGGKIFEKSIFADYQLYTLQNIVFDDVPTPKNVDRLIHFFERVTQPVLQDFSIRWINKNTVWLDRKQGQDISLLLGSEGIANIHDIEQCQNMRAQITDPPCKDKRGKPCKNKVTWVCDLRFDQQVVLFSTNKGV
jgi:hypothetical protein